MDCTWLPMRRWRGSEYCVCLCAREVADDSSIASPQMLFGHNAHNFHTGLAHTHTHHTFGKHQIALPMERTSAGPPSAARFVDWLLLIWLLAWRWRVFTPPEPRLSASSSAAALAETASAPAWPPISASRKPGTSGNKMMRTVSLCTQASGSNSTGWAGLQVWQMPRGTGRLTKCASAL